MKTSIKLVIACTLVVVGAVLISVGAKSGGSLTLRLNAEGFNFEQTNINTETYKVDVTQNINEVVLDVAYANIYICTGENFNVSHNIENVNITQENGILAIESLPQNNNYVLNLDLTFTEEQPSEMFITIPQNYNIQNFEFLVSSGDIYIENQTITTLNINNNYGDVTLKNLNADDVILDQGSGDLYIEKIKTSNITIANNYGDTEISGINAQMLKGEVTSGNFTVNEAEIDSADVISQYGDVTFNNAYTQAEYSLSIAINYGDIHLNNIETQVSNLANGNGDKQIKINAESGDVDLNFIQ